MPYKWSTAVCLDLCPAFLIIGSIPVSGDFNKTRSSNWISFDIDFCKFTRETIYWRNMHGQYKAKWVRVVMRNLFLSGQYNRARPLKVFHYGFVQYPPWHIVIFNIIWTMILQLHATVNTHPNCSVYIHFYPLVYSTLLVDFLEIWCHSRRSIKDILKIGTFSYFGGDSVHQIWTRIFCRNNSEYLERFNKNFLLIPHNFADRPIILHFRVRNSRLENVSSNIWKPGVNFIS